MHHFRLALLAILAPAAPAQQLPETSAPATADGAMLIVTRLLAAAAAKDDAAFNKVAGGLVIMLAPDFGAPVSRAEFAASLENCTAIQVVSSEPFPKMPEMQSVRITMQCRNKAGSQSVTVMADVMADNEHAVAVFPGGVSKTWPTLKR